MYGITKLKTELNNPHIIALYLAAFRYLLAIGQGAGPATPTSPNESIGFYSYFLVLNYVCFMCLRPQECCLSLTFYFCMCLCPQKCCDPRGRKGRPHAPRCEQRSEPPLQRQGRPGMSTASWFRQGVLNQ